MPSNLFSHPFYARSSFNRLHSHNMRRYSIPPRIRPWARRLDFFGATVIIRMHALLFVSMFSDMILHDLKHISPILCRNASFNVFIILTSRQHHQILACLSMQKVQHFSQVKRSSQGHRSSRVPITRLLSRRHACVPCLS